MHQKIRPELERLAGKVIGAAIEVHRRLGAGFAEVNYHKAMIVELGCRGISHRSEVPVELRYRDVTIGEGRIDLPIEDKPVVELKSSEASARRFKRQASSYLKATGLNLALVINFECDVFREGLARVINTSRL
jgi:GxxExxY protein